MKYKSGYKHQLHEAETFRLNVYPDEDIHTDYIHLLTTGELTLEKGYAWDGPSGPTIATKSFMRGSAAHDALYQLLRMGLLEQYWRKQADVELQTICLNDGMFKLRSWWIYRVVRLAASPAAQPSALKEIHEVP